MRKYLAYVIVMLFCLATEIKGQDLFPLSPNYGLLCDEAEYLCGYELDGYMGSLTNMTSPLPQPNPICANNGSPENVLWFSFVADDSNLVLEINFHSCVSASNQPGLSTGLYQDCILSTDNVELDLDCETLQGSSGSIILAPDPSTIVAGQIYYLFVDGYAAAVCDFNINVISGVCVEVPQSDPQCDLGCGVNGEDGNDLICVGIEETYSFWPISQVIENLGSCGAFQPNAELENIIHVDWEITPATGFTITNSPMYYDSLDVAAQLDIVWDVPGVYTIRPLLSINPLYETCRAMCDCLSDSLFTVTVVAGIRDTLAPIFLCPGMSDSFCGQLYNTDAIVECVDTITCDVVIQEFIALDRVDLPIDTHYICPGNCFEFNMMEFCLPSLFNIPSLTACDTFYQIQLIELDMEVSLASVVDSIDCVNDRADLSGAYTVSPTYTGEIYEFWLDETGDTIARVADLQVTEGGTYTYYAVPIGIEGCFDSKSVIVYKDTAVPNVLLTAPPTLDCNTPTGTILMSVTGSIASAVWTGPGSYSSMDTQPTVTEGGTYQVTVTTTNNCIATEDVLVMADFAEPVFTITHDTLDCTDNLAVATYTTTDAISTHVWTYPDGQTDMADVLSLAGVGIYTLQITGTNGCSSTQNFVVTDETYNPSLAISQQYIWRCDDTEYTVDETMSMLSGVNYQWLDEFGTPASDDKILVATGPGVYTLVSTDLELGCIGYDTVTILTDPDPFLGIVYDISEPTCAGGDDGSISIASFNGGEGPYRFVYDGIEYTDLEGVTFPSGISTIEVWDANLCMVVETFTISNSAPFDVLTEPSVMIKYGESSTLTASASVADSLIVSYTWTDADGMILGGDQDLEVDGSQDAVIVTIEDVNGCTSSATVDIVIDYEVEIFYPNIFSPNGDGSNDNFFLYNNGLPETMDALLIFDRAGELMYEGSSLSFNESQVGWDGSFNGRQVQPGVYVFMVRYTLGNGEQRTLSGSITVVL